eukprot:10075780-Alexandrium_andersonii.AAC.1
MQASQQKQGHPMERVAGARSPCVLVGAPQFPHPTGEPIQPRVCMRQLAKGAPNRTGTWIERLH